jgi:translation elongation factor EF-1beta
VSKKAKSKESTPPLSRGISPAVSPRGSRVASRNVSDDESEYSDWGADSIDGLIAPSEIEEDAEPDAWIGSLEERIEAIIDRKRSSTEGREEMMRGLCSVLTRHYAQAEIEPKINDLLPALLKSVKSGQSEREITFALKAIALILITDPSETIYDAVRDAFKKTIEDSPYPAAKIAAIHALSVATFYGGAAEEETEEIMDFFLDIASSDGAVIEETDNAQAVVAALEEWGFLATQLEDVEDLTEAAMDTFVDQLESSDANVQIAAGDNIALLFEKSYTEAESDDEPEEADAEDDETAPGPRMVKRYTVYRQVHQLQQQLEALSKASSKRISKKDRKNLHLSFNDVLSTVENPKRGPRYSTALDPDGRQYGSRLKVAVHGGKMTIDKWWKLHRLNGLKRLLQGGFMAHYEFNQTVFDSLPVIVEDD